jgi:hypothetical protein
MLSTTLEDDDDRDGQAHQSSGRVDAGPIQRESQHAGGAHRGQPHGHPAEQEPPVVMMLARVTAAMPSSRDLRWGHEQTRSRR